MKNDNLIFILLLFVLITNSCKKDEVIIETPQSWSEGFPYNANEYPNLSNFVSDVIHQDGYNIMTLDTTNFQYTGFDDQQLIEDIQNDLNGKVPENEKQFYLNYLSNSIFQNAVTPNLARYILGSITEGKPNTESGAWEDINGLKEINRLILQKIVNSDDRVIIRFDEFNGYSTPSSGGTTATTFLNSGPNGEDLILLRGNLYKNQDFNGTHILSVLVDELAEADIDFTNNSENYYEVQLMQWFSTVMYLQKVTSIHGLNTINLRNLRGAITTDRMTMSFLNGWKSTIEIENILSERFFNSERSKEHPNGWNTIEESGKALEGGNSTLTSDFSLGVFTEDMFTALFDTPINKYDEENLNKMIDVGHTFFDLDERRIKIENELK